MAALVWFTVGVAVWHFAVFFPDRFRGGIIGAFAGAVLGAMVSGALWHFAMGDSLGETDILTALAAVPGCIIGMWIFYLVGSRDEEESLESV